MDVPTASKTTTNSSSGGQPQVQAVPLERQERAALQPSIVGNNKNADAEHPEDAEREDGKWMRTEANKRKSVEDDEESMVRKTMQCLKTSEKTETRKESEGLVEIEELAQAEVN